jgi:hypothetical protein
VVGVVGVREVREEGRVVLVGGRVVPAVNPGSFLSDSAGVYGYFYCFVRDHFLRGLGVE